jgi:hypothetical protein
MKDMSLNKQELPKWFITSGGICYKNGAVVCNKLSGESIELTNMELSMYDFIKGCEIFCYMDSHVASKFNKALNWFRKNNPKAYMVLLD